MSTVYVGASDAARLIERTRGEILDRFNRSVTMSRQDAIEAVYHISQATDQTGLPVDGGVAISGDVRDLAIRFIRQLPLAFPQPQVSGESDGNINLEWYRSPRRVLSVSVAPGGRLHWAALIGTESPRGVVRYTDRVPPTILDQIARVFEG